MQKSITITLLVLLLGTQTAQAGLWNRNLEALGRHFGRSLGIADKVYNVGKTISDHKKEARQQAELERLKEENRVLFERTQREQEKETYKWCRQCERSANPMADADF